MVYYIIKYNKYKILYIYTIICNGFLYAIYICVYNTFKVFV